MLEGLYLEAPSSMILGGGSDGGALFSMLTSFLGIAFSTFGKGFNSDGRDVSLEAFGGTFCP